MTLLTITKWLSSGLVQLAVRLQSTWPVLVAMSVSLSENVFPGKRYVGVVCQPQLSLNCET